MINGPLERWKIIPIFSGKTYDFSRVCDRIAGKPKDESMSETDESDAETQAEFPVEKAGEAEPEIAALICTDEGVAARIPRRDWGSAAGAAAGWLAAIILSGKTARIVCHAGTYAEVDDRGGQRRDHGGRFPWTKSGG